MRRALAVLLLALTIAACGGDDQPVIHRGKILAHHHDDAYQTMRMQCYSYDSRGACNVSMPVFDDHPEVWWLSITDCLGDQHSGCRTARATVDQATWDSLHDGQVYDDGTTPARRGLP